MVEPLRRRRVHKGRLRGLVAAVTLSLLATALPGTPAQAAPSPAPTRDAQRNQAADCGTPNKAAAGPDGPWVRCFAVAPATNGQRRQQVTGPPDGALGPAEIRSAYQLPDGGDGQTVAIVGAYGYAAAEADLAVFRAHYGLPPCTTANGCFRKVDQVGGTDYPAEDAGWSIEAALDLDAVSSACPRCKILFVQAENSALGNMGRAVDTAVRLGAVAISNSYGVPGELSYQNRFHANYDHPGVAITVASGDIGNVQSFPATHPDVTSVGGTLLTRDSSPRGWSETAWSNAGSGCSALEERPAYQAGIDTHCGDKRASADISATAAPESGLAVYNTLGQDGWAQWGGTSLAAPLVAAMYALAGDPLPGTYPVAYPYRKDKASSLTDVTEGSNGWCGDLLCTAGPGWDGPTGLGTPRGVSALTLGPTGTLTGTVTTGKNPHGKKPGPVDGVTITATDRTGTTYRAVTDDKGRYRLDLPAGGYDVVAAEFGYQAPAATTVTVPANGEVKRDITVTAIATRTLTGTVTDGSGHGWPMYAKVAIDGYPGEAVFTDPYTGRYRVDLPVGSSYTLHTSPVAMPGYLTSTLTTRIDPQPKGSPSDVRRNVALAADRSACAAPGYAWRYQGVATDFTGWTGGAEDGWQVSDEVGSGLTWRFDDPGKKGNLTGGAGAFAAVDTWSQIGPIDTALTSPSADLSGLAAPVLGFDSDYSASNFGSQSGSIELSLDAGKTWSTVFQLSNVDVKGRVDIPVPQAAGKSGVRVRFRYQGELANWWQVDTIVLGSRTCAVVPGGIVAGQVRDGNTGAALLGATVTGPTSAATSLDTTADRALDDGYYWLFAEGSGSVPLTVSGLRYADSSAKVRIDRDRVVRRDWSLAAGRLVVDQSDLSFSVRPGHSAAREVRLRNDGDRPLRVRLVEQDRGRTTTSGEQRPTGPQAPLVRIPVDASVATRIGGHRTPPSKPTPPQQAADGTWVNLPSLPTALVDNVVADNDGAVYSVGGDFYGHFLADGYVLDPQTRTWKRIADMPQGRAGAVGGFIDGKLYVAGGLDATGAATATTYAYDPMTDRWSKRADLPSGVSNAAGATVDGKLYVVAGCADISCYPTSAQVYRYDPSADRWQRVADYPVAVTMHACGATSGGLVCTGGYFPAVKDATGDTFRYYPDSDTWVATTSLNVSGYGMGSASVDGKLRIIGGVYADSLTNEVREFDPATGVWSDLPNANVATYRGGAACGTYQIGGLTDAETMTEGVQQLTGGESCVRGSDVSWLSADRTEMTIPAGRSVTITLTAAAPSVVRHGEYAARLAFETDTPYRTEPVGVVLKLR